MPSFIFRRSSSKQMPYRPPIVYKDDSDAAGERQHELGNTIWTILASYLKGDGALSLEEVAEQVSLLWDDTTVWCVAALMVPIQIAKLTPYDDPNHKKLAEFMLALDRRRSEVNGPPPRKGIDSLGNFSIYLWDAVIRPDQLANDVEDPRDPITYANFCAFLANMIFPDGQFHHVLAKHALNYATEIDSTATVEVRDAWIIGAAQFIIFQVPTVFDEVLKDRKYVDEAAQAKKRWRARLGFGKRQPLHDPDMNLYWDDWQAWKRAFRAAASDETHGAKCRDIAQKAADMMALQEKIEDDRSATM